AAVLGDAATIVVAVGFGQFVVFRAGIGAIVQVTGKADALANLVVFDAGQQLGAAFIGTLAVFGHAAEFVISVAGPGAFRHGPVLVKGGLFKHGDAVAEGVITL